MMMKSTTKFIAKPNTWFKEGSEAKFIECLHINGDNQLYGVFEGIRVRKGQEIIQQEVCCFDEFYQVKNE